MIPQKRFWTRKKLNTIPVIWLFVCAVLPLCMLCINSFVMCALNYSIFESVFSFFNARSGFITIFNSIFVALISTLLGFYLVFFAIFQRSNLRYMLFFVAGFCFVISPIIHYECFNIFFDKSGILNSFLLHFNLISKPILLNNYWILLISLVYKFFPISFFLCIPALHNTNTNLVEYTLDIGGSSLYVIANNIIFSVKHQLVLSFGIIALLCFGNISLFITPFLKGTFVTSILLNNLPFQAFWYESKPWNQITTDIHLSLFILIWGVGIYLLNRYFNKHRADLYLNPFKRLSKYKCVFIGKDMFTTVTNLCIIMLYVTPVLGLLFYSIKDWKLNLFFDLFNDFSIYTSLVTQYIISIIAAVIATIFGTMLAVGNSKSTDLRKHLFYKYTILSLTVSETILFAIARFGSTYVVINPLVVVVISLSIMGTFFSSIYVYNSIRAVDKNIEKASIDLGANYWQTIKSTTLHAIYPSVVSCFLLVFACLFNEFTITAMLLPPHSVMSQKLLCFSVENLLQIYPLSVLNILFTVLILLIASPYNLYSKTMLMLKSVVMALLIATGIILWILH